MGSSQRVGVISTFETFGFVKSSTLLNFAKSAQATEPLFPNHMFHTRLNLIIHFTLGLMMAMISGSSKDVIFQIFGSIKLVIIIIIINNFIIFNLVE